MRVQASRFDRGPLAQSLTRQWRFRHTLFDYQLHFPFLAGICGFDVFVNSYIAAALDYALENERAAERQRTGGRVLGRRGVLAQSWRDRPASSEPRRNLRPRVAVVRDDDGTVG